MPGYDGPTGLGTPNSDALYKHTNPKVTIAGPKAPNPHKSLQFKAKATERIAGAKVTSYLWRWGDGKSTTTKFATTHHTYAKAGRYTVTLIVTDNRFQKTVKTMHLTV